MSFLFATPGNDSLANRIAELSGCRRGDALVRRFPDGESYVRVQHPAEGEHCFILCTLARPDPQFLRLAFLARQLRDQGAAAVTLVAPYLPYLRQDQRFRSGEALTSVYFADLLGREVDRIITVAPHLHRLRSLERIYSIPCHVANVTPLFAEWIRSQVARPLLVGPDAESEQWVSEIADRVSAPYVVLSKRRKGDKTVEIKGSRLPPNREGHELVIIDDILSSGATLSAAAQLLIGRGFAPPRCLVVHALARSEAVDELQRLGCRIDSTDTVPHLTNRLSVAPFIAELIQDSLLDQGRRR